MLVHNESGSSVNHNNWFHENIVNWIFRQTIVKSKKQEIQEVNENGDCVIYSHS